MSTAREPIYWEPRFQVRHSSIIRYSVPSRPLTHARNLLNYKTYAGEITNHSSKRLKKTIDILLQLSPERMVYNSVIERLVSHTVAFITLTISAKERHLTPMEGHKLLLSKWLLRMKRKAGMTTYIWKAEYQKNGQLHYHITTPSWIPYYTIRDEWNNICSKAGFLTEYHKEHPGKMPNSTDVHKVYKIKNIQSYLVKYMSKKNENRPVVDPLDKDENKKYGKVWDCSMNLKQAKYFSDSECNKLQHNLKGTDEICGDFFSIHYISNPMFFLPVNVREKYQKYLQEIDVLEQTLKDYEMKENQETQEFRDKKEVIKKQRQDLHPQKTPPAIAPVPAGKIGHKEQKKEPVQLNFLNIVETVDRSGELIDSYRN